MLLRQAQYGQLRVEIYSTRKEMGAAAAELAASWIRELLTQKEILSLVFASAPSQNEMLEALRSQPGIDWQRIQVFHLDEYVGLGPDHPASFRRYLQDHLLQHVKPRAFHGLDGLAPDLSRECRRYEALLRQYPPDLVFLGIGENGHLAFNDPPACDFEDPVAVKVVQLDETCRLQQVHDGAFPNLEAVPRVALTLTVPFLMSIPRAVIVVPGPTKRQAVKTALEGPIEPACPASILRRHPQAVLFLDQEAASLLSS